jgi:hypothetical protein
MLLGHVTGELTYIALLRLLDRQIEILMDQGTASASAPTAGSELV